MNNLHQIVDFLKGKNVKITPDNLWLRECLDYFHSECSNATSAMEQEYVMEQWLLADLRDIGEKCLPNNLANITRIVLVQNYALQVDSFLDVGHSRYAQYQKIKNVALGNLELEGEKDKPAPWEPKSKRMLKMTCTDGVQSVYGMEYKPIPELKEPFIPGCKIIIIGPVECKKGVLLLEPQHIRILGGEVDSLVIRNALENILARDLKLKENPDPFGKNASTLVLNATNLPNNAASSVISLKVRNVPQVAADNEFASDYTTTAVKVENVQPDVDSDEELRLCQVVDDLERSFLSESVESVADIKEEYFDSEQTARTMDNVRTNFLESRDQYKIMLGLTSGIGDASRDATPSKSSFSVAKPSTSSFSVATPSTSSFPVATSSFPYVKPVVPFLKTANSDFQTYSFGNTSKAPPFSRGGGGEEPKCREIGVATIVPQTEQVSVKRAANSPVQEPPWKIGGPELAAKVCSGRRLVTLREISDYRGTTEAKRFPPCECKCARITEKPKIKQNEWRLKAVLKDDEDETELDVSFSNPVLEKLFGRSSKEMIADKKFINTNPSVKESLDKIVTNGMRKISSLEGFFKILKKPLEMPEVVEFHEDYTKFEEV